MNLQEVTARYGLTKNQMVEFLKRNYEELNSDGEHVKSVNHDWIVDDAGIETIDKLLNYNNKNDNDFSALLEEKERELNELKARYQQKDEDYKNLQKEYTSLQNSFLSLQDGKDSINSDMIRKYKKVSENLQREVANARARCEKIQASKDEQYQNMQSRIEELQSALAENNAIQKEKVVIEHRLLDANKRCDLLQHKLSDSEKSNNNLTDKLQKSEFNLSTVRSQLEDFKTQASSISSMLATVQVHIKAITEEENTEKESSEEKKEVSAIVSETVNTEKEKTVYQPQEKASEPEVIKKEVPAVPVVDTSEVQPEHKEPKRMTTSEKLKVRHLNREGAPTQRAGQEQLINNQQTALRAADLENKKAEEEAKMGVFASVRQRVASFIGFM